MKILILNGSPHLDGATSYMANALAEGATEAGHEVISIYEPPRLAVEAAEELDINIATPRIGESVDYEQIKQFTEHWWELI